MVPSGSALAPALKLTVEPVTVLLPVTVKLATGDLSMTTTFTLFAPVLPELSVTVKVTVNVPAMAYTCVAVTPVAVPPSPKVQAYDAIVPPGSTLAPALKLTVEPVTVLLPVTVKLATGGWLVVIVRV